MKKLLLSSLALVAICFAASAQTGKAKPNSKQARIEAAKAAAQKVQDEKKKADEAASKRKLEADKPANSTTLEKAPNN
jgi:hypothetical protein